MVNQNLQGKSVMMLYVQKLMGFFSYKPGFERKIQQIMQMSQLNKPLLFDTKKWDKALMNRLKTCASVDIDKIESIEAYAEGSIAKIFKIRLQDKTLAAKVVFPDLAKQVSKSTFFWSKITKSFKPKKLTFDSEQFKNQIDLAIKSELDVQKEYQLQKLFFEHFKQDPKIRIPEAMSCDFEKEIILSQFENSLDLSEFLKVASKDQQQQASEIIIHFYLESLFNLNIMHSDPNPGNFGFRITAIGEVEVVIYDFGAVVEFSEDQIKALKNWIGATLNHEDLLTPLKELGFDLHQLKKIKSKLQSFSEILLEPFIVKGYNLNSWNRKARTQALLGENRWVFMQSAPPHLMWWMRAFQGLFYYPKQMSTSVDLATRVQHELSLLAPKKENIVVDDSSAVNRIVSSESAKVIEPNVEISDNRLCIELYENNKAKMKLDFKSSAIFYLEEMIDESIKIKLKEYEIHLPDIVLKAQESGFEPQELLRWKQGNKEMIVELRKP